MSEFDDPFNVYPHSQPSGKRTEDGREIRFIGQPILALNRATNDMLAIAKFQNHPLLQGQYFYTLPRGVIDAVVAEIGKESFDTQLLKMERELSDFCGDHSLRVGLWQGLPTTYQLRDTSLPLPPAFNEVRRMAPLATPREPRKAMADYEEDYKTLLARFRRGYIGWLMTNPQFLDEHDALLAEHAETVKRWGTDRAGFVPAGTRLPGTDPNTDPQWSEFTITCESFFGRWRLRGLAGPYLPMPLEAMMVGTFPISTVQQFMRVGGFFYWPDVMPVPSRDQIRDMLNDALRAEQQPAHLKEWLEIVRADNPARNQLEPYSRQFEIQHYWRLLYQRHPGVLVNNIGKVKQALAGFFDVSFESIHKDWLRINERLGDNWLDRPWPI